jgi:hypothetical protein
MPFFTRTGKAKRSDWNRQSLIGRFYSHSFWRSGIGNYLSAGWTYRFPFVRASSAKRDAALVDDRTPSEREPWHDLPEAELTPEQERKAQRRAGRDWQHHETN